MISRVDRTTVPTAPRLLCLKTATDVHKQLSKCQEKQKFFYDKQAKTLPALNENDTVRIERNKIWIPATVTAKAATPRSFVVTTPNGQTYRRNRRHIIKTYEEPPEMIRPIPDIDIPSETEPEVIAETPTQLSTATVPPDDGINGPDPPLRRSSRTRQQPAWFKDYQLENYII